jgi:hypothetical protein
MLDVMDELGLIPNATLHHFTHPLWFEDLGAFKKEENIAIFVEWSEMMFREFGGRIHLWATFNEPTVGGEGVRGGRGGGHTSRLMVWPLLGGRLRRCSGEGGAESEATAAPGVRTTTANCQPPTARSASPSWRSSRA